jgi:hypothetical protein
MVSLAETVLKTPEDRKAYLFTLRNLRIAASEIEVLHNTIDIRVVDKKVEIKTLIPSKTAKRVRFQEVPCLRRRLRHMGYELRLRTKVRV